MHTENNNFLKNPAAWALLVIRIALGVIFVAHGSQKLFGAFGGPGMSGVISGFDKMGLQPAAFWAWLVALVEFFGGLAVIFGLLTRLASFALAINMLVAIILVHLKNGFFAQNGGFEYQFALFMMAVSLVFAGAGPLSLDYFVRRWFWKR